MNVIFASEKKTYMAKEKFVKLTRNLLREIFLECNSKYFEGKLPLPEIFELWTPSKKVVGWIRGVWVPKYSKWETAIHISKRFKWTKENLEEVMVHEMIHFEIQDYMKPWKWWHRFFSKDHGQEFKDRMKELNDKFGLNVKIKAKQMRAYQIKPVKKPKTLRNV